MPGFEDLEVWRRSIELSVQIYRLTADVKDFGFRDQITRASRSIPSNIAEGMERSSAKDKTKFLDYAKASCGEVRTQAIVGMRVGFIPRETAQPWIEETKHLSAMLVGLIRSLR